MERTMNPAHRLRGSGDPPGLVWLDGCGSTNDEAWGHTADPLVRAIAADHQTAGRGRRGRRWHSPAGCGLYFSWLARPRFDQSRGAALPLLAAAAVADLVAGYGPEPVLKWPNDVLVDGRKVAGILCEARGTPRSWIAVVGIGLNVRRPPGGWPAEVPGIALTEVLAEGSARPTARSLAGPLLDRLSHWLIAVERSGLGPVIDAWSRYAPPAGTRMRQGGVHGAFAGLAPDGALRLETDAGIATIHAGEVDLVADA